MKLSKWAFALAIAAAFWPGAAVFAQIGSGVSPQHRTPGRPANYSYGDYYARQNGQPAPAEAPAAEAPAEEEAEEETAEPWRIVEGNRFCMGFTLKNYLAQSFTWNPSNPVDRFNGPVTWTDRSNEYQLNEAYFSLERVTNTEDAVMDIGARVDVLYGTNYRFDTAAGLEDKWNGHSFYGVAMPNLYVEGAYNDFKLKVGHFTSPVGYFAVGTANNFFNTIPYTFQYGEPFTHTGIFGSYKFSDQFSLGAGVIQGWDNFGTEFNSHLGYLGTLNYAREEQGDSISFVQIYGEEPNFTPFLVRPDFSPRYLQTFVYSRPLKQINEDLTFVFQTDFGAQENALANGDSALWYGINTYLLWKQDDCWSWGGNFEWFRDEDGFRVGGFLPNFATGPAPANRIRGLPIARSAYEGSFYQVGFGPKWTPNLNTIVRPNLRWDWFDGTSPAGLRPFDDGTKNWQVLLNVDVVFLF